MTPILEKQINKLILTINEVNEVNEFIITLTLNSMIYISILLYNYNFIFFIMKKVLIILQIILNINKNIIYSNFQLVSDDSEIVRNWFSYLKIFAY